MIKRIVLVVVALTSFIARADTMQAVSATASLKDGSTVKGEFHTDKVEGTTLFTKGLVLDAAIVKDLAFTGTNGAAKVELSNGDRFGMSIGNPSFTIKSLLGELKIPCGNIRSISLSKRLVAAKRGASDGLIFHCTFDDEASITSPAVGPAGTFMTGRFEDGRFGKALLAMPFTKHAAFEFPVGFIKDSGCIEFWAKILKTNPAVGTGGDPRLLAITFADTHEIASWLDVGSNDGTGNSGFTLSTWFGARSSIRGGRHLQYTELFSSGNWRDWHHYAVVWDKNGILDLPHTPKAALLVDGKLVTSVEVLSVPVHLLRMPSQTPYILGITYDPALGAENTTKSPFLIDEYKIWNHAKTDSFRNADAF